MDELLSDRYRRRLFFLASIAALVALVLIRFLALPKLWQLQQQALPDIVSTLLDTFITSLVATLLVASLVLWLTPPTSKTARMDVVEPFEITKTLGEAHQDTDEWWYRGHSGRHFRAVTLPKLATEARAGNVTKKIVLQILDPTAAETCQYYAAYRQRLRSAKRDQLWTRERVQNELLATIVSAYSWRAKEPGLSLVVGLLDAISLFRVDLSARLAIITKEDPQEPALRCDAGTFFYRAYKEDLLMSLQQARQLPPEVKTLPPESLTQEAIDHLFQELGLDTSTFAPTTSADVLSLVKRAENPYA